MSKRTNDPFDPESRTAPYIKEGLISKDILLYEIILYKGDERIKVYEGLSSDEAARVRIYYSELMSELNPNSSYKIACDVVKVKLVEIDRAGIAFIERHVGEKKYE